MPPITYVPIWVDPLYNLSMLIWPALATGYRYSAVATRMTRSAMLEVLREDYVRTARAKGLFQKLIVRRHALAQRAAARGHHHRHRVRVPDGRSGGHRAGVQSQRARQAVRRVGVEPRLQHDPGPGDAGGGHLRPDQPGDRHPATRWLDPRIRYTVKRAMPWRPCRVQPPRRPSARPGPRGWRVLWQFCRAEPARRRRRGRRHRDDRHGGASPKW